MATMALNGAARAEASGETPERSAVSTVLFGSMEAGPTKSFAALGVKRAFGTGGLDASGFRTMIAFGVSRELAGRIRPYGTLYKTGAQAVFGYEWRIGDSFVALYAGSDAEGEQFEKQGVTTTATRYGWRLQGDLWAVPTRETMVQASAYASTLDRRLWGRISPGWLLPQGFYAGPEIEAYRDTGYTKLRLGLHLTGLRLLGLSWRLAGGWQRTSDRPSEAYATLGLHWRR